MAVLSLHQRLMLKIRICSQRQVSSVEDTVAELESLGISCEEIRTDTCTGKPMSFFKDPDGLPIEIHE